MRCANAAVLRLGEIARVMAGAQKPSKVDTIPNLQIRQDCCRLCLLALPGFLDAFLALLLVQGIPLQGHHYHCNQS